MVPNTKTGIKKIYHIEIKANIFFGCQCAGEILSVSLSMHFSSCKKG